jgi:hypothetical protein
LLVINIMTKQIEKKLNFVLNVGKNGNNLYLNIKVRIIIKIENIKKLQKKFLIKN